MQVVNSLATIAIAIKHGSITTVSKAGQFGYLRGNLQQMTAQMSVIQCIQVGDVALGDYQEMQRRLGLDITKSESLVVFIHDIRLNFTSDHFAKQTIIHGNFS